MNRNQILITLDSLRWDVFETADIPNLKRLGTWKLAYTPATFTYPAHQSFFVGKLPQTISDEDCYDDVAIRDIKDNKYKRNLPLWRLVSPEVKRDAKHIVSGRNIIHGFQNKGYVTIGTGAVGWFNNKHESTNNLIDGFDHYKYFGINARKQIDWVLSWLPQDNPYFLFMNFGETHHPFKYEGCSYKNEKSIYANGDQIRCLRRQCEALEYLDKQIGSLMNYVENADIVICADHGEALGEDGRWGHGFYHPKVMEVPMLITEMK